MGRIIDAMATSRRIGPLIITMSIALWAISCTAPQTTVNSGEVSPPSTSLVSGAPSQGNTAPKTVNESRTTVITYTVQTGENLFSIADKYNLHPETILWANEDSLASNPRNVRAGLTLTILPVNGVLYRWHLGDDLAKVAERFSAKPEDILNWPGNQLDPHDLNIVPGTALIIPGGHPPLMDPSGITIHMSSDLTPQP